MIRFETTLGDFTVELFEKDAPVTVANFLKYIDDGFFDGTIFHRIVPGFVIQGGGFTEDMTQKRTQPPDQERGRQRLEERARHLVHGAHQRHQQRHVAVLRQPEGQRFSRSLARQFRLCRVCAGDARHGRDRQDCRSRNRPAARFRRCAGRGGDHEERARSPIAPEARSRLRS